MIVIFLFLLTFKIKSYYTNTPNNTFVTLNLYFC